MVKKKKTKVDKFPDSEKFDFIKTVKGNIKGVVKIEHIEYINQMAIRINKIVIHSYFFIKMYFIYLYDNNISFPLVDEDFIKFVFTIVTVRDEKRGQTSYDKFSPLMKHMTEFFNIYYKPTMNGEIIKYDKLSYSLAYEAIDMVTNINNNIKEHFITHFNKLVNQEFNSRHKKNMIKKLPSKTKLQKDKKKQKHKELNHMLKLIKNDILSNPLQKASDSHNFESDEKKWKWIIEQRNNIIPDKLEFQEGSINYDLKVNPQDYLKSLIYIGKTLEKKNSYKEKADLFNFLPLRTNCILFHNENLGGQNNIICIIIKILTTHKKKKL